LTKDLSTLTGDLPTLKRKKLRKLNILPKNLQKTKNKISLKLRLPQRYFKLMIWGTRTCNEWKPWCRTNSLDIDLKEKIKLQRINSRVIILRIKLLIQTKLIAKSKMETKIFNPVGKADRSQTHFFWNGMET
jgi:hypothetical protein